MTANDLTDAHLALQLFPGYTDLDIGLFAEFTNPEARPEQGFITDFLGSRMRVTSLWKGARKLDGTLLGIPVPNDFHAEAVEWIGLLKAVRGASQEYVAMELGAGFGPWIVAGGVAARRRGIESIRLYAVESDPQHFRSLCRHFTDNDFEPSRHKLIEAAVGTAPGVADWPVLEEDAANEEWGLRPLSSGTDNAGRQFSQTKQVQVVAMRDLVLTEPVWDLIHIDVQGDEVDICRSCIDELNARVRWLIVGTHSRKIDGDLVQMMFDAGWLLENEKPARFIFSPNSPKLEAMTRVDGTQVWRNPRLTAIGPGDRLTTFSQEISCPVDRFDVAAGATYSLAFSIRNTGNQPWFGGSEPASVTVGCRWVDTERDAPQVEGARALLERPVEPGERVARILRVTAPLQKGQYALVISMVQEGVAWFADRGAEPLILYVTVT